MDNPDQTASSWLDILNQFLTQQKTKTLIPNFTILQKKHIIIKIGRFPFMSIPL